MNPYEKMDPHTGMFPDQKCLICGKQLNKDGRYPAELYAGTFTGLCYACTSSKAYRVAVFYDGAERWSYPPHCPSWRRARETYTAYPDCTECNGRGRIVISRANSRGGLYTEQCRTCSDRFRNEPKRAAYWKWHDKWLKKFREIAEAQFVKFTKNRKDDKEFVEQTRQTIIAQYDNAVNNLSKKNPDKPVDSA